MRDGILVKAVAWINWRQLVALNGKDLGAVPLLRKGFSLRSYHLAQYGRHIAARMFNAEALDR